MSDLFQTLADAAFERRKQKNGALVRKDNARLHAGSPMYYYCRLCGAELVLDELHTCPAPRHCLDCIHEGRAAGPWE